MLVPRWPRMFGIENRKIRSLMGLPMSHVPSFNDMNRRPEARHWPPLRE